MTATYTPPPFTQKSPVQIRTDILRTKKNGLQNLGIANPNVGPGSPDYVDATAVANEIAVGQGNIVVSADRAMPDTASGAGLDRWGLILNRQRRGAVGSHGNVTPTISATGGTNITAAAQLTDTAGNVFQVAQAGIYQNGQVVPVYAVSLGASTNHLNGDTLTWSASTPPFCAQSVTVGALGGADGLVDGADSEVGNDEPYRARILDAFRSPSKDGNAARVIQLAAQSSDAVGLACCYPALLGAGTTFVSVSAIPQADAPFTSTSKSRALPAPLVAGTVLPFLQGALGGQPYVQALSTVDDPTVIAVQIFLPSAPTASPPGPGGGWLDGAPWPPSVGSTVTAPGTAPVQVTGIGSTTVFTLNATTAPVPGVSRIACLSANDWHLYTATVLSYTGTSGAYTVTVDTPFPLIAVNDVFFPQCVNQQTYVDAILGAFAQMGPGEWSTNADVLGRAFRHPSTALSSPSSMGAQMLKPVISSGPEVAEALFLYRADSFGVLASPYTPPVPATVATGPSIFTPGGIGFYPL